MEKAGKAVEDLYKQLPDKKVYQNPTPADVQQAFEQHIPESGMALDELVHKVEEDVFRHATLNVGPYYYGDITGGNQAGILGEMIKAALNQNNLK
ncbi:MAG: hypothetical protein U5K69_11980 [Balneolaceae bacterium]|nr:hypothetical protein [Balneolaceae bacterium]